MSREVDLKALVSHIIKGDGADRCRICMGDTSEGQVYLGDTVMMDGDKAISLAELLESITGVEVSVEEILPAGVCSLCSKAALQAYNFRTLCHNAGHLWKSTADLLNYITPPTDLKPKSLFAMIQGDSLCLLEANLNLNVKSAARKLNELHHMNYEQCNKKKKLAKTAAREFKYRCECPNCGKKFRTALLLSEHLKFSSDMKRACFICARIFHTDDIIHHIERVHKKQLIQCKKCLALFGTQTQYLHHKLENHASLGPNSCTCGDCGRTFANSHGYHAHVSIHAQKSCPQCDKYFRNSPCYQYHVKKCCNLHKERKDIHQTKNRATIEVKNRTSNKKVKVGLRGSTDKECICDYCGKKFAGKKFVAAHIQIIHTTNTHKPCQYCGKLLAASRMTEHLKKHEPDDTVWTCEHCGLNLKTKLGYVQHKRLHTGEKPYPCVHCGEQFSASSRRSEHIRNRHKKDDIILNNMCKICPARFRLPSQLKKHISTVHNSDNRPIFECAECFQRFGTCRGLLHHSRKHQKSMLQNNTGINNTPMDQIYLVTSEGIEPTLLTETVQLVSPVEAVVKDEGNFRVITTDTQCI